MKKCLNCESGYQQSGNAQRFCDFCRTKKCRHCGKPFVSKQASAKQVFCSLVCSALGQPEKLKKLLANRGNKPRTWHLNKRDLRGGVLDIEWRNEVFKRDNYTCQLCDKRGCRLNADHIKPYKRYPELRHILSNGRTLCFECHRKTPTYGWSSYWHAQKRLRAINILI